MDKAVQNIILERLCSALTDILTDIVKYCKLDHEAQETIRKNVSSIKNVFEISSHSVVQPEVEKSSEVNVEKTPIVERVTRQGVRQNMKRKSADVTKLTTTKPKKGRKDSSKTQDVILPKPIQNEASSSISVTIDTNSDSTSNGIVVTNNQNVSDSDNIIVENNTSNVPGNDLEVELVAIVPEKKVFLSNLPSQTTVIALEITFNEKFQTLICQ